MIIFFKLLAKYNAQPQIIEKPTLQEEILKNQQLQQPLQQPLEVPMGAMMNLNGKGLSKFVVRLVENYIIVKLIGLLLKFLHLKFSYYLKSVEDF